MAILLTLDNIDRNFDDGIMHNSYNFDILNNWTFSISKRRGGGCLGYTYTNEQCQEEFKKFRVHSLSTITISNFHLNVKYYKCKERICNKVANPVFD